MKPPRDASSFRRASWGRGWFLLLLLGPLLAARATAGDYLSVDLVPFATDRTENLLVTPTEATLTVFFRNKYSVLSQQTLSVGLGAMERLAAALKRGAGGTGTPSLGGDDLIIYDATPAAGSGRMSILPLGASPNDLSNLLREAKSKGSYDKQASYWMRSVPFRPSGEPRTIGEKDLSATAWADVLRSVEEAMRFVSLKAEAYRALEKDLGNKRQAIVFQDGQYFELRLYESVAQ